MLWHNRGLYRALIFQQCSTTILLSHIHTTKSFFSTDCRQIDIEEQLSSRIDSGNSAYFIYTENPQDTLSWNRHSFLSGEWYMVITQFLQLFYPLYIFQDGIYRTIKVNQMKLGCFITYNYFHDQILWLVGMQEKDKLIDKRPANVSVFAVKKLW